MILVQLHVRVNAALAGFIRMQRSAADDFRALTKAALPLQGFQSSD